MVDTNEQGSGQEAWTTEVNRVTGRLRHFFTWASLAFWGVQLVKFGLISYYRGYYDALVYTEIAAIVYLLGLICLLLYAWFYLWRQKQCTQ